MPDGEGLMTRPGSFQAHTTRPGPVEPDSPPLPEGLAELARFILNAPQWLQIGTALVGALVAVVVVVASRRRRRRIAAWVGALSPATKAAAGAVVVAVTVAVSAAGYRTHPFVEHDNPFYTGCHLMEEPFFPFTESAHAELRCKDCHVESRPESAWELSLWIDPVEDLTPFRLRIHRDVADDCAICHSAHVWEVGVQDHLSYHPAGGGRPPTTSTSGRPHSGPVAGLLMVLPFPIPEPVDTIPGNQPDRPFTHQEHEALPCLECHDAGERHPAVTVQTERDCAACHHDTERSYVCQDCHRDADLLPEGPVAATMEMTVREEARIRDLPFDHDRHGDPECQECHGTPVTMEVDRECGACHDDHHVPEAECTRCHLPTEPEVHGLESHLTCGGSGCHAGEAAERPTLSRTLCLACHAEQEDHEPEGTCHACHMIPEARPEGRSEGPSAGPPGRRPGP